MAAVQPGPDVTNKKTLQTVYSVTMHTVIAMAFFTFQVSYFFG
jgi:hypothetical protein